VIFIKALSLLTSLNLSAGCRNQFETQNELFTLNLGMANLNPSTFLDNVQWKIVKQFENTDFHSDFHKSTVTTNFFKF